MLGSDCVNLLISVAHPAHVHLFKNLIWDLENRGHEVKVIARNKEMCKKLLDIYGFKYDLISNAANGLFGLGLEMVSRTEKCVSIIKRYKPDIVLSMMDPSIAIASKVCGKKYVSLADTEHAKLVINLALPFTDMVLTPSCFKKDFGNKQIRYEGYHELAYLHPNVFQPNPNVLSELGLTENDSYIVMRFVSWGASHDVDHKGFTLNDKRNSVKAFEKYGRVFITSEATLPPELEKYRIVTSPEKVHDLLYYATLLYGESATMASECAVLGTHAIFCDYAGRGYTDEEEEKYDLVYNFKNEETMGKESLSKAIELLENPNLKKEGKRKRELLLKDKIDVTAFIMGFIENHSINNQ
jgi:predicted glycosyltransferase